MTFEEWWDEFKKCPDFNLYGPAGKAKLAWSRSRENALFDAETLPLDCGPSFGPELGSAAHLRTAIRSLRGGLK